MKPDKKYYLTVNHFTRSKTMDLKMKQWEDFCLINDKQKI